MTKASTSAPASVDVLSPWPTAGENRPESGVAHYTEMLVSHISAAWRVRVLGQRGPLRNSDTPSLEIQEVWRPSFAVPLDVIRAVRRAPPALIHVQHEFNIFGGLRQGFAMTAGLRWLHRDIPIVSTLHGVVDLKAVDREFTARYDLVESPAAVRWAMRSAIRQLAKASSALVVHHEHFRDLLVHAYGLHPRAIFTVPMGSAAQQASVLTERTRDRILVLGFLTGYKLPELVVDLAISRELPGATFEFCVGFNPRADTPRYRERYRTLESRVQSLPNERAQWRGYISDPALETTIARAGVLVLPYTDCVSVSAVAALAQAQGTPVCYSRALRPLLGSGPLEFELNVESLARAVRNANSLSSPLAHKFPSWDHSAAETERVWRKVLQACE